MNTTKNMPLSEQTRAIILGSLLGDGSLKIAKGYANARFSFRHSEKQADYFHWKVVALQDISSTHCTFHQQPDGFSREIKIRYQSLALASLTELYNITHRHNQLEIQRKWLNQMTALSLAIWWFDDGSIIANGRKGVLCTDGFSKESVKLLARYLEVAWHVHTKIGSVGRKQSGKYDEYYRLWFRSTDALKQFLRIILPYTLVAGMLPKVLLLYSDSQLQQRWISEVVQRTRFTRSTVQYWLRQKQQRWQRYRE